MKDGSFDGQELAFRCWVCDDSQKHPSKAHASLNVFTGLWYCYRCQSGGKMSAYDTKFLTKGLRFDRSHLIPDFNPEADPIIEAIEEKIRPGQAIERYSALDRWHIKLSSGKKLEMFKSQMPSGEVVGYHARPQNKKQIRTFGKRMFGMSSKIRYDVPWRLVEGPYDAVDPHCDVALWGFPSEMQARALRGKELIICPDGDVFQDYRKLRAFMKYILWNPDLMIKTVERLPPDTDPDMVMPHRREKLEPDEVKRILTPKKTFFVQYMKPKQILDTLISEKSEEEFWNV